MNHLLCAIEWGSVVGQTAAEVLVAVILAMAAIFWRHTFAAGRFALAMGRGLAGIPALRQKIDEVHHEVHPNNGKSIPDRVARLEDADQRQSDQLSLLIAFGKQIIESQEEAMVQCDAAGDVVWVSERWCKLAGIDANTALGRGWSEAIADADLQKVKVAWADALRDGSALRLRFRFRTGVRVESIARPIFNGDRIVGWRAWIKEARDNTTFVE